MSLLARLNAPERFLTVELRPPRAMLAQGLSMDAWMGMHRAVRRILRDDTALFLTDNAVGAREEENLNHLGGNLERDVPFGRICPFLTCKHTLEHCLWFADRAVALGHTALTVLGGDQSVGAPRCVPHAHLLRQQIRERHPELALGGWANPHRDALAQVGYLMADDVCADFYLTQIVSHHDKGRVAAFVEEADRRGLAIPGVFGVFYYRSPNPKTLAALSNFLSVPAEAITREFGEGASADEICARSIRALKELGITRIYVSNLLPDDAPERLSAIRALV